MLACILKIGGRMRTEIGDNFFRRVLRQLDAVKALYGGKARQPLGVMLG